MATKDRTLTEEQKARMLSPDNFLEKDFSASPVYWEDWLERWANLKTAQEMVSWLHIIFDTVPDRHRNGYCSDIESWYRRDAQVRREQILFCCGIIRSRMSYRRGRGSSDGNLIDGYSIIAKAIALLIGRISNFKENGSFDWLQSEGRGRSFINSDVLPEFIASFRDGNEYSIFDLPKKHEQEILRDFFLFIIKLAWSGEPGGERILFDSQKECLRLMKPEFIKMLVDLRWVNALLDLGNFVSRDDIRVLQKIVIRDSGCVGKALISIFDREKKAAEVLHLLKAKKEFASQQYRRLQRSRCKVYRLERELEGYRGELEELGTAIAFAKKRGAPEKQTINLETEYRRISDEVKILEERLRMTKEWITKNYR